MSEIKMIMLSLTSTLLLINDYINDADNINDVDNANDVNNTDANNANDKRRRRSSIEKEKKSRLDINLD
jgi:hypothetical protein